MNEENTKRRFIKNGLTLFETIIVLFIIFSILWILLPRPHPHKQANSVVCLSNMKQLGLAFQMYAQDNSNTYPTPERWCDLIKPYLRGIDDKVFRCPAVKEGKYHYAMNSDCEPNSPPDTVLLFETKGGWNLSGGTELLTTENHSNNTSNIYFKDGSYKRVRKEEIPNLKWNAEEKK